MDEKTREALKGSIDKWEAIVDGTGADFGVSNCPLCALFFDHNCNGCPVSAHTGQGVCCNTPYEEWSKLDCDYIETPRAKKIAQEELDFLKSLLPSEAV